MKKLLLILAVATAGLLSACSGNSGVAGGDAVELQFKPKKGESYLTKMSMDMGMDMFGSSLKNNMLIDMQIDIEDVKDNGDVVSVFRFKKIRMQMNIPGEGEMVIDPDNPDTSLTDGAEMAEIFRLMRSFGMRITMSKIGEYKEMHVLSDSIPQEMMRQVNETFKSNMGDTYRIYPDGPVKVGESWEITFDKDINGNKVKSKSTYTLKEIMGDKAILSYKTEFIGGSNTVAGVEVDGEANGEMTLFIGSGMIANGINDMEMNVGSDMMTMTLKATVNLKTEKLN